MSARNQHVQSVDTYRSLHSIPNQTVESVHSEIKRSLPNMTLTNKETKRTHCATYKKGFLSILLTLQYFQIIYINNYLAVTGCDIKTRHLMPPTFRRVFPFGFRQEGVYLNGIATDPKYTQIDIVDMLIPKFISYSLHDECTYDQWLYVMTKIANLLGKIVEVNRIVLMNFFLQKKK